MKRAGLHLIDSSRDRWESRRLKHSVLRTTEKAGASADLPYVGLDSISSWSGRYLGGGPDQGDGPATLFKPGDVLFGKLRPYLAKAWAAEFHGRCSSEALVMRPLCLDAGFLRYLLLTPGFVNLVDASTYGAKMPRAEWDFIGDIAIPVPPRTVQASIVDYLDRKTAAIDDLIAKKERLIELLEEKRRALITRAVTKGLDPGVRMKESALEWAGPIPRHWPVARLGFLAKVTNGTTPDRAEPDYWTDGAVPWLSSGKVNDGIVCEADEFITERARRECSLELLRAGTVLVGMIGQGKTRGMSAITTIDATINQNTAGILVGPRLAARYLLAVLTAAYVPLREFGRGGQQDALNCRIIGAFPIPVPPVAEQHGILEFLARAIGPADVAASRIAAQLDRLREYRQALITAAVTGQIDVGNLADDRDDVVEKAEAGGEA